jgi:chromosome segregation ATPase
MSQPSSPPTLPKVAQGGLEEFRDREAAIQKLKDKYTPFIVNLANGKLQLSEPKNYEVIRVAIGELRALRVVIDKRRKELKADALEWGRRVDGEAHRLTDEIEAIEKPLKMAKEAQDEAKERAKRAKAEEEQRIRDELAKKRLEEEEAKRKAEHEEANRLLREREAELAKERERVKAEKEAIEARERVQEAENKAERERLASERRALTEAQNRLNEKRIAQEAKEKAEADARAKLERERVEAEERKVAEAERQKRLEALKPDKEKLAGFAKRIRELAPFPEVQSQEARMVLHWAHVKLAEIVTELEDFAQPDTEIYEDPVAVSKE